MPLKRYVVLVVSHAHIPDLSSFSQALHASMALALALTYASSAQGRIKSSPRAAKALDSLRTKTLRFQAELELMQKAKLEAVAELEKDTSDASTGVELLCERIATFRATVDAVDRAALSVDRALVETMTFDAIYHAAIPGWREKTRTLRQLLVDLREMLASKQITAGLDKLAVDVAVVVQRATAESGGLSEWASTGDDGDADLLDPNEGEPVSWDQARGWH